MLRASILARALDVRYRGSNFKNLSVPLDKLKKIFQYLVNPPGAGADPSGYALLKNSTKLSYKVAEELTENLSALLVWLKNMLHRHVPVEAAINVVEKAISKIALSTETRRVVTGWNNDGNGSYLALNPGDEIRVLRQENPDFWLGTNVDTGISGLFRMEYTEASGEEPQQYAFVERLRVAANTPLNPREKENPIPNNKVAREMLGSQWKDTLLYLEKICGLADEEKCKEWHDDTICNSTVFETNKDQVTEDQKSYTTQYDKYYVENNTTSWYPPTCPKQQCAFFESMFSSEK
jgi:hypothetical protein